MEESLEALEEKTRSVFASKIQDHLKREKRQADLRRVFTAKVNSLYPTVRIAWLKKYTGMSKVLLGTYSGEQLIRLIDAYVGNREYHRQYGISFDSFYRQHAKVSLDLDSKEKREATIKERGKTITKKDIDPSTEELETFKKSGFFDKLPQGFKDKLTNG